MSTPHDRGVDPALSATRALVSHVFELAAARRWRELAEYVHADAQLSLGVRRGVPRQLRGEVLRRWLRRAADDSRTYGFEPRVTTIEVLEPALALATGTLRAPLRGGGHVSSRATWVLVFRDGLLYRVERRTTLSEARAVARRYADDAREGDR